MKPRAAIGIFLTNLLGAFAASSQLAAQQPPQYQVTFLGTLGGSYSVPEGMNKSGDINGYSVLPGDQNWHAFLWQRGVMTDLGTLGGPNSNGDFGVPFGPNEVGQVVGGSETSVPDPLGEDFCFYGNFLTCTPFVWSGGVMTALPTLGGNNGNASDINNRGQIVGVVENTTPDATCSALPPPLNQVDQIEERPVVWDNGVIHELPTFPGDPDGGANAVNDNGQIVGASGSCSKGDAFALHALLWEHGVMTDLGNLGGTLFNFAESISNQGQVTGTSDRGDGTVHAFVWTRGNGMQDLGTLPGDLVSSGHTINDKGQVVGQSCDVDGGNCRGFVWQNGVMTDLNTLVPGGGSTFFVFGALGISSRGEITLAAFDANTGNCCAFLATPSSGNSASAAEWKAAPSSRPTTPSIPENIRKQLNRSARRAHARELPK